MRKALYRKWRPQIFEDVIGQEYIITVLKNQVASGNVGHAYLFTGTRGTGKTTCAKIFAKAVNCELVRDGDPCLECPNCKSIANGSAVDVTEIDAASNTGVDNIRDIIEQSAYLPATCKYRVYIIDEVHMLSTSAFNALLKIMEEPPAHVIFILATTEIHQVPVTIISRCQRFDFSRIGQELISSQLNKIADGEKIELDADAAQIIARLADGGMRDAISIFDQCSSFDNHVTAEVVSKVSGQADRPFIEKMAEAVCQGNTSEALGLSVQAHTRSLSYSFIVSELIEYFRDIMIIKSVGDKTSCLLTAETDTAALSKTASELTLSTVMYYLDILSNALNSLGKSEYPGIAFEQCLIRLCSPFLSAEPAAIISRIEKLEKRLLSVPADFSPFSAPVKTESIVNEKPSAAEKKSQKPAKEVKTETAQPDLDGKQPFILWEKVMQALSQSNPPLYGALKASRAFIEGDVVFIDTNDFTFALLKGSESNRQTLKAAVAAVSGKPLKIAQHKKKASAVSGGNAMAEILKRAKRDGVSIEKD